VVSDVSHTARAVCEAPEPRDDHRPNPVVGVGAVERVDQLAQHRGGERVHPLGPVERAHGDVAVDLVADLCVCGVGMEPSYTVAAPARATIGP
jgi:hypothetical protein